jgi:thiopeptide-type bacteriocin biosynthesis protein
MPAGDDDLRHGWAAIAERTHVLQPIVGELEAALAAGRLTTGRDELATALVHMHVNRMLASDQRAQELVLYDFLARSYASQLARARASGKPEAASRTP